MHWHWWIPRHISRLKVVLRAMQCCSSTTGQIGSHANIILLIWFHLSMCDLLMFIISEQWVCIILKMSPVLLPFFSACRTYSGQTFTPLQFLTIYITVYEKLYFPVNASSLVNKQSTLSKLLLSLTYIHKTFWWFTVRKNDYMSLQTVLVPNMFAATLVSTSLRKQTFLWWALEDFTVFIPCFHNLLLNGVYSD